MAKVVITIEDIEGDDHPGVPVGARVCKTSVDYGGIDYDAPTEAQLSAVYMLECLKAKIEELAQDGDGGALYERWRNPDGTRREIHHGASPRKDH